MYYIDCNGVRFMPKVSIIIPVYNASEYLYLCLNSIISQNYENLEIIVVDDKSTDNSITLIKQYQKQDSNIKLIRVKRNQGVSHARNVGINASTGDYLFFIDSDDCLDEDTISKLVKLALENKADVVETKRVFWSKRNKKISTFLETKNIKSPLVLGSIRNDFRSITMPRYVTGKLYKRCVIGDVRFDENIRCYEDSLFNHQIKPYFKKYMYADNALYHYLQRPSSLINTISINHMDYLYAGRKIKEAYENGKYNNKNIKSIVDNLILDDIIVIQSFKIPKMKLSRMRKDKCINDFMNLIDELSPSDMKLRHKIIISLFKNSIFRSCYFFLTSHINLIGLGFRFLALIHPYKVKNNSLKQDIIKFYNKLI